MKSNFKSKLNQKKGNFNLITEIPNYENVWYKLIDYYPKKGNPGICYLKSIYNSDQVVESFTFRNQLGILLGVIDFYLGNTIPMEKEGNCNILVHPDFMNKGIGKKLLEKGDAIWKIDFSQQKLTPSGLNLVKSYLKYKGIFN